MVHHWVGFLLAPTPRKAQGAEVESARPASHRQGSEGSPTGRTHAPTPMPRSPVSCWIILLALSDASVSTTASRSRSSSVICVSTNSNRASKRLILACARSLILLKLFRPRMWDSGRDQLPPDVRFCRSQATVLFKSQGLWGCCLRRIRCLGGDHPRQSVGHGAVSLWVR
jgi:hypothetical protein